MSKAEIIPAILPKDFAELEDKVLLVHDLVKTVQVDVCDGQFVPNSTWPYKKHDETFERLTKEEAGLPGWEKVDYEVDLMVNRAEEVVEQWVSAGVGRIVIHAEMKGDLREAVDKLKGKVEIGLALNIETSEDVISPFKEDIQFIQCMGINSIGFQGQKFDPKVIQKIQTIKEKHPLLPISVDGGVSLDNAGDLIGAGADRLVIGSAIFDSENIFETIKKFKKL